MKLRIRSLESKETLKIETPNPSALQNLKDAIAEKISGATSETLHLSLNRKDEIIASPMEPLNSLGIASGDLIYYTQNPNGFSTQAPIQVPTPHNQPGNSSQTLETNQNFQIQEPEKTETLDQEHDQETLVQEHDETLEEDSDVLVKYLSCVPRLLERVYREEVVNGNTKGDHKLLIVAVHAVFLESGFVCFDSVKKKKIDGFLLPEGWASNSKPTLTLQYTVTQLLNIDIPQTVDLKFQIMGKFLSVFGSLSRQKPVGFSRLDASRFVPSIKFLCDSTSVDNIATSSKSNHEKEVFELWKIVKDGLALPLLIQLCDKTGLESPPCFMCLPTDLKLKILEFLPGADIAKLGCVSLELKYLSSNNDLWRLKCIEEFSLCEIGENTKDHWKEKYVRLREIKRRKRRPAFTPFPYPSLRRGPARIIGGDHDRFPAPFGSGPTRIIRIGGDHDRFPAPLGSFPARRGFVRHYTLGGDA